MSFQLRDVVPWGRSFEEYEAMFALSAADLEKRILGCGDGPASFNAIASRRGIDVVSADPIYRFSAAEIAARVKETAGTIETELRENEDEFVWSRFRSVDELVATRLAAMDVFLEDYALAKGTPRYVDAALPDLPFSDDAFDLALCSHFLLLYARQLDLDFHVRALLELCRVAAEVRVFPVLELGSRRSRHLDAAIRALRASGYRAEVRRVDYELQKGGNEMLAIERGR